VEWRREFDAYLVGGVPRDLLLFGEDVRVQDCDVVVLGGRGEVRRFVEYLKAQGFRLRKYSLFGTAEMERGGMNLDVAMARRERYAFPGALPEVEPTDSLYEDSLRRDFTANALYHDGERILDFHGGVEDIGRRILRPLASFADDPTRALRGVRYRHKLNLRYGEDFFAALPDAVRYISNVSLQRILNELRSTSILRSGVLMGFLKDALRFSLLRSVVEEGAVLPRRVYLGFPSPHRWVIPLVPFLREGLPLTRGERDATLFGEWMPIGSLTEAHLRMHSWGDLRILAYMTWRADEEQRRLLRLYLRLRRRVRVKLYPHGERYESIRRSMERLGLRGDVPEACRGEPESPRMRALWKLRCEGALMDMALKTR